MSVQEDYLQDIADAIREKESSSGKIQATKFAERIKALPTAPAGGLGCLRHQKLKTVSCDSTGMLNWATQDTSSNLPRVMIANSTSYAASQQSEIPLIAYRDESGTWYSQYRTSSSLNEGMKTGLVYIYPQQQSGLMHFQWSIYPDGLGATDQWMIMLFYDE